MLQIILIKSLLELFNINSLTSCKQCFPVYIFKKKKLSEFNLKHHGFGHHNTPIKIFFLIFCINKFKIKNRLPQFSIFTFSINIENEMDDGRQAYRAETMNDKSKTIFLCCQSPLLLLMFAVIGFVSIFSMQTFCCWLVTSYVFFWLLFLLLLFLFIYSAMKLAFFDVMPHNKCQSVYLVLPYVCLSFCL